LQQNKKPQKPKLTQLGTQKNKNKVRGNNISWYPQTPWVPPPNHDTTFGGEFDKSRHVLVLVPPNKQNQNSTRPHTVTTHTVKKRIKKQIRGQNTKKKIKNNNSGNPNTSLSKTSMERACRPWGKSWGAGARGGGD